MSAQGFHIKRKLSLVLSAYSSKKDYYYKKGDRTIDYDSSSISNCGCASGLLRGLCGEE